MSREEANRRGGKQSKERNEEAGIDDRCERAGELMVEIEGAQRKIQNEVAMAGIARAEQTGKKGGKARRIRVNQKRRKEALEIAPRRRRRWSARKKE